MKINCELIKLQMALKGFNQTTLAAEAGLSRQGLNAALSRGSAEPNTIVKIATVLKIAPEKIILSNGRDILPWI